MILIFIIYGHGVATPAANWAMILSRQDFHQLVSLVVSPIGVLQAQVDRIVLVFGRTEACGHGATTTLDVWVMAPPRQDFHQFPSLVASPIGVLQVQATVIVLEFVQTEAYGHGATTTTVDWATAPLQADFHQSQSWAASPIGVLQVQGLLIVLVFGRMEACGHGDATPTASWAMILSRQDFHQYQSLVASPTGVLQAPVVLIVLVFGRTGACGHGDTTAKVDWAMAPSQAVVHQYQSSAASPTGVLQVLAPVTVLVFAPTEACGHGVLTPSAAWAMAPSRTEAHQYQSWVASPIGVLQVQVSLIVLVSDQMEAYGHGATTLTAAWATVPPQVDFHQYQSSVASPTGVLQVLAALTVLQY
jgi:hypothetical protein